MTFRDEETGSRDSDESAKYSASDIDTQKELLLDSTDDVISTKKTWHGRDGQHEPEDDQTAFCINRWWKLVLFLVFWTALLPLTVNWVHQSPTHSQHIAASSDGPARAQDDYVLSQDWDMDAAPQLREYTFTIKETEFNPDGVYRTMLLINNQFPGPLIRVNEDDTLRVTVNNEASNATSLHWHGIYQNGTNHMDGTVGVTQCPIASGSSFTYEFTLAGQSGTYWYHAHQGVQASDGLIGPLIIHGRKERQLQKIDYATDRVIMVSDHYHELSGALTRQYLASDRENSEPVPDAALINGKNVRDCSTVPNRKCDNTTSNVVMPTFDLAPNENHRLRILNVGAFAEFQFQIDEHVLAVTEVDGTDVWPQSYHRLNLNPAQRYSVVVNTNQSSADSFWMRARMIPTCFAEPNPYLQNDALAVIRYSSIQKLTEQTAEQPKSEDWSEALWLECRDLNTTELVPVEAVAAPEADAYVYLRSNFEIGDWRLSRGVMNSTSYRPNVHSPTLMRAMDGFQDSNQSFTTAGTNFYSNNDRGSVFVNEAAFDKNKELVVQSTGVQTIDLLIHNFDDGNHPFHLHGYKFFVLAQGHAAPPHTDPFGQLDRANVEPLYRSLDLSNPLRRDTASVEAFGWTLIRFVADNPGAWAFHCHVSWHTEAGLLMQFLTRTDLLQQSQLPEDLKALCAAPASELEKGCSPSDEVFVNEAKNGG